MKNLIAASTLFAVALVSNLAHAADTAELKVKGVIKPVACTPTFAAGGVVDYGTIQASTLPAGQFKTLDKKQIDLNIKCDSPTKMAIKLADNRAASKVAGIVAGVSSSSEERFNFGLGTVAGKNVGGYALSMDNAATTGDSQAVSGIYSANSGSSWSANNGGLDNAGNYFSFAQGGATSPAAIKTLAAKINVQAVLNKPENLPLTQDVPLDGSATLEVVYL
ncbi:DUF1120 domain-containing protein [Herbaspirillum lusitanum]|jgi:hypothetical protein|uniref:DUF1120 domain-containing protein n=1 Tax=Herbaspirillum lusitanum TaxID=213312 RepID=A0ABW9ADV8_9BURK